MCDTEVRPEHLTNDLNLLSRQHLDRNRSSSRTSFTFHNSNAEFLKNNILYDN